MKIGITYDTPDMYNLGNDNELYFDFAELASINILKQEIESLGYQVELLGNADNVLQQIKTNTFSCDLVYNTAEGIHSRNREGLLPSLFELCHIPYIGTDAFGLSLTLDKYKMKILAHHLGILTPDFCLASPHTSQPAVERQLESLHYPVILKPNFEGNSSGIVVCKSHEDACVQVKRLLVKYQTAILCEEFIFGQEITVPTIGNDPEHMLYGVTSVDIQKSSDFWLDTDTKMFGDYHNIALKLPQPLEHLYKDICVQLFLEIGCCDFARFDFRMTEDNRVYFIEANPLPALFRGGAFDVVGQQYGYSFAQTLQRIISEAADRQTIPKIGTQPKKF